MLNDNYEAERASALNCAAYRFVIHLSLNQQTQHQHETVNITTLVASRPYCSNFYNPPENKIENHYLLLHKSSVQPHPVVRWLMRCRCLKTDGAIQPYHKLQCRGNEFSIFPHCTAEVDPRRYGRIIGGDID